MKACKPVTVPRGAFLFCKYSLAVLLWAALIFRIKWMVVLCCIILALSAAFKIGRAPLILFYTYTINLIFKSRNEVLDEHGMRFAHTLGAVMTLLCVLLLYFVNDTAGWIATFIVAIIKTTGALGYCSGLKLYSCMNSGGCCSFLARSGKC